MSRPVLSAVLSLALVAAAGCDRGEPGSVAPPDEAVTVSASHPIRGAGTSAYPASVVSTDAAELATRTSGTVKRVRVDIGSRVAAGDTLLELDATDVAAGIEGAEASVRQARKRFERIRSLEADGAATRQELDDARAALERARAALKGARGQREYVVLRAPFDGTVTTRSVDPGDLAVPGRPVLRMVRPSSVKVVADLPAGVGAGLEAGDPAAVLDPESGWRHEARVVRTSPARHPSSRRVRVELRLTASGGPPPAPGSYVRLELVSPADSTTWIPADAVVRRGQLEGVFLADGERLELRWLELGDERADAVELLGGLPADARVVRRPGPRLADGVPVESVEVEPWTAAPGGGGR